MPPVERLWGAPGHARPHFGLGLATLQGAATLWLEMRNELLQVLAQRGVAHIHVGAANASSQKH
jgi:hypothetical protein